MNSMGGASAPDRPILIQARSMTVSLKSLAAVIVLSLAVSACQTPSRTAERLGLVRNAPNPGPCPAAYALFEAARYVEIDGEERLANVGFTGEINGVRSFCRYYEDEPIIADLEIDFGFGRGPNAGSDETVYEYFVTVTRRDLEVIHKETFPLRVDFNGRDRVYATERIAEIVIPRARRTTSGTNFEIIVGFVVNEDQAAFNREGKRFREGAVAGGES